MGAGATPAGWYPDVERPGGERFWNGSSWTEDRRAGASEGAPAWSAQAYGQPAVPVGYAPYAARTSQYPGNALAGWGLGLSIFGLVCCGVFCVAGTIMGAVHLQRIKRNERDPGSRGLALAAVIVGAVGIGLYVVGFVLYAILIGVSVGS